MADPPRLRYPSTDLSDGVVLVRRWSFNDLGCIEEASHDPAIAESTTVPVDYSAAAGRAFIERQWARQAGGEGVSFAITDADTNVANGLIVLIHRPQPGVVGLGYWMVQSARGRQRASRAATLVAGWALRVDGVHRVEAWVEPANTASQHVVEAAGFRREGILRSFLVFGTRRADAVVYSLLPEDVEHLADAGIIRRSG